MTLARGSQLGPYEILTPIGAGGMGEVYRARDPQLGRDVAIKVLPENVATEEERLARFENEARLASSLNHPNIVTIHSIGGESRYRYIAMEFIDGPTLQDLMEQGPIPVNDALSIAAQVANGLAKAHEAGIIHRDLKPKNVMVTKDGQAKILDFGLSKLTRSLDSEAPTATAMKPGDGLTQPGTLLGTAEYMSPEQAAGRPLDFRSDQFSLGSLIYAILTGKQPFHRGSAVQTLSCIIEGEPPPVSEINPRVPHSLQTILNRCLMKDPGSRYASTRDLARDLHQLELDCRMPSRAWGRRDWARAIMLVGLLLVLVGGIWVWTHRPYQPQPVALDWYRKGSTAMHSMTFEAARKAFDRAVAADPKFALAQAGLARAYDELDYSERAKEWMLRATAVAQETRLSVRDQNRLRALQFMVSRDYDRAAPLLHYLERTADSQEKPSALLETGWLAQQREDTEGAAAAYERALKLDPGYAAAKLRLGFIQQRRGENDLALKSFAEAVTLYSASGDPEGVTEALYQRANLLNRRSRAAEAMPFINKALSIAHTEGNRYQEIRLQLLQSVAARNLGQNARAIELAQRAIEAAAADNLDNLATSGMVALGNSFLARRDLESAETYFRQALDLARRGKVRRYEALASTSLGSIFEQRNRPEEARRFIEAALPFYRQAGYRREFAQSMTILGGVLNQLGEYEAGIKVLREALPGAIKLQDTRTEVLLRERLADIFQNQGNFPESLRESERVMSLLGPGPASSYGRLSCAGLYWRIGRRQDAEQSLTNIEQLLKTGETQQFFPLLKLRWAEIAYADGQFEKTETNARMAIAASRSTGNLGAPGAKLIQALVWIRTKGWKEAGPLIARILQELEEAKMIGNAASAKLATAEALISAGDKSIAKKMALEALDFFEPHGVWESVWRVHVVAARASGEPGEIQAHREAARSAFAQLSKLWPDADIKNYLQRPDIKLISNAIHF
jgi:tetratricopeptide (TPR) repeat protein